MGGHVSGFRNIHDYDNYVEGDTRVFRIRGTSEEDVRACQQEAVAGSLESDDVFLVMQGDKTWLWEGKVSVFTVPI